MRNIEGYTKHLRDLIREKDSDEYESKIRILKKNGELIATVNSDSLSGLDLSGRILSDADLSRKYLKETIFIEATLDDSDLSGADLTLSDLTVADLSQSDLTGAILTGANFHNSHMERTKISGCSSTQGVNFSGAYMYLVEARNCDLEGSDFTGAGITYIDFTGSNLRNAIGLEKTKNPQTANFKYCDLTGVPLEFFMRLLKSESEDDLSFYEEPRSKKLKENQSVTLEDFLMGCKGVPWSTIKKTTKTKNLFGV
jgi:uncharacterized protein YjbI with pentapeptide repeats